MGSFKREDATEVLTKTLKTEQEVSHLLVSHVVACTMAVIKGKVSSTLPVN